MELGTKEFKREYNGCKIRIKKWEDAFKKQHDRAPNKDDIKEAPADVRKYYKRYWYLKSAYLEQQILPEKEEKEIVQQEVEPKTGQVDRQSEEIQSEAQEPPKLPSCKTIIQTKSNPELKSEKMSKVEEKLFEGSSFKKRNPRKSFLNKNKSNTSTISLLENSPLTENSLNTLIIKKNEEISFSVEKDVSPKIKSLIGTETNLSPLMAKFDSSKKPLKIVNTARSLFSQNTTLKLELAGKVIDRGWLERCNEAKASRDSGFESFISNVDESFIDTQNEAGEDGFSEDDVIFSSDDEESRKLMGKRKLDEACNENASKKIKLDEPETEPPGTSFNAYQFVDHEHKITTKPAAKTGHLEKKMKAGTLNENYVKVNLKKKVFVRGKRNFNFSKYKKKQWKMKKKELNDERESGGVLKCFQCGDVGHFARDCLARKEDKLQPLDDDGDDATDGLPSLEEAEELAREMAQTHVVSKPASFTRLIQPEPLPDDAPDLEGVPQPCRSESVAPLNATITEVEKVLKQFGHDSFRDGQCKAVMRILRGQSTLLMLGTGGGKSLCYQLPAFMYHQATRSIALVVSPLVSLMEDQVSNSSSFLKLGCLHNNQTDKQRKAVIEQMKQGDLCALLVSPEAVVSCDNFGFGTVVKHLPPISFACIDEVHCVSQWSHNFRPSYLMLTKVLRERFAVKTFLGLTATARKSTADSIAAELGISDESGIIKDIPLPEHLILEVVEVDDRDKALLVYIKEVEGSTLVYCCRREECERLAALIRTALNGTTAAAYHAGLTASRRKSVQKSFMSGRTRVVVATVAFGMGINKKDIRGVLHYNMPKDWESYVQEVGRAGRDGKPSLCRLLLSPTLSDLFELRRHIHANSVDRHVLRKLLARVFHTCKCVNGSCKGHEIAFPVAETVTALDVSAECIETQLCYLEGFGTGVVQILSSAYNSCKIQSYQGLRGIEKAARKCPPLAVAAAQSARDKNDTVTLNFDVIRLADKIGWDSGIVKRHLKQAEWFKNKAGVWRRTGLIVSFSNLSFRVRARGDLTPTELDKALNYLLERVETQEKSGLDLLQSVYSTLKFFAKGKSQTYGNESLASAIRYYFQNEILPDFIPQSNQEPETQFNDEEVASDVRQLVCTFKDNTFNGRAVARIFQGIQSPNYPASLWFKTRYWRAHLDKPFHLLQQIATQEILRLK